MSLTRQDAWTQDEDLLLAEVVLRHIREGSTQLRAFEEVGRQLSRTSAACGFRWNSFVRKQYTSGIEHAKKQRKENKIMESSSLHDEKKQENKKENELFLKPDDIIQTIQTKSSISFQEVIVYLKEKEEMAQLYQQEKQQSHIEFESLKQENKQLREEVQS